MPALMRAAKARAGARAGVVARGQSARRFDAVFIVQQPARDFVDRADFGDRDVPPDLRDDRIVELDIAFVAGGRDDQIRTFLLRFPDRRTGRDAVALGFARSGDRHGGVAADGGDDDRSAAQSRLKLLLDAGEIAVEIQEQPAQRARRQIWNKVGAWPDVTSETCVVATP